MSAPASIARLRPLHAERFEAWRVTDLNEWAHENAWPIDVSAATTLAEAENLAKSGFLAHKDKLAIVHHRADGRTAVHFYAIKQRSTPDYRRNPRTGLTEAVRPLYVDPVFSMRVDAFEPRAAGQRA